MVESDNTEDHVGGEQVGIQPYVEGVFMMEG